MQTTTTINWNKGEVVEEHNERDEELCKREPHIDYDNFHGSSSHENWQIATMEEKYEELFGDAIEEYNAKQTRKDRKITVKDYMQSVIDDTRGKRQTKKVNGKRVVDEDSRQGKQLSYEFCVKVGNTYRKKDSKGRTVYDEHNHHIREEELPRDLQKTILRIYYETFQERNPNLIIKDCCYHADEGFYNRRNEWEYSEDHLHMEVIPMASGFKRGLGLQNSMNKAMLAMGFNTPECYHDWAKREQEELEKITYEQYEIYCEQHPDFYKEHGDLTIYHPVTDKTREGDKSKEQLAQEQELGEVIGEIEDIKIETEQVRDEIKSLQEQLKSEKEWEDKLIMLYRDYDSKRMQVSMQLESIKTAKAQIRSSMLTDGGDADAKEFIELHKDEYDKFLDEKYNINTTRPEQLINPEPEIKHHRKKNEEPEKVTESPQELIDEIEGNIPEEEPKTPSKAPEDDRYEGIPEEYRNDPVKAMQWMQKHAFDDIKSDKHTKSIIQKARAEQAAVISPGITHSSDDKEKS